MKTLIIVMLQHGHAAANKMDKAAEAFWWPGMYRLDTRKIGKVL